jgi:hypothetical protein
LPESQKRDREGYLVEQVIVIVASIEEDPDCAEHHSNIGAESYQAAADGPREPVAMDLNVKLFSRLFEAAVGVKEWSVDLDIIPLVLESNSYINDQLLGATNS